jgi:nitrogen fixation NifU-like protein
MAYSDKVMDHYENPRNVGKWEIADNIGIIEDAKFKTYGCGSAIASSSLLTEWVKGMSLGEAGKIKNTELAAELALPPVKIHCSVLAEDAIKAAVLDYQGKHPEKEKTGNYYEIK